MDSELETKTEKIQTIVFREGGEGPELLEIEYKCDYDDGNPYFPADENFLRNFCVTEPRPGALEFTEHHIISPGMIGLKNGFYYTMFWWPNASKPNSAVLRFTDGQSDRNLRGNIVIMKSPMIPEEKIVDGNLDTDLDTLKPYLKWFPGDY